MSYPLRKIVAVVADGMAMFEYSVPCEVFGVDRSGDGMPRFDFQVCTPVPGKVTTGAVPLLVENGLEVLADADLAVLVPVGEDHEPPPELVAALHEVVERGGRVISLCSGAFTLARTGLLEGRRATTHWYHEDEFRRTFPDIELVPDVLYVEDGPIATSAGTAAAIDLCLHLVRQSHGSAAAAAIARRMVVPAHRDGGQAQFVETPVRACSDDMLGQVMEWASARLGEDLSVQRLAARAAMSERTFARRFREETGTTPHHWVLAQRVALAEQLLEAGAVSIEDVARQCGFGSATMLRHHFTRLRGTTPTAYRRMFGTPQAAVPA